MKVFLLLILTLGYCFCQAQINIDSAINSQPTLSTRIARPSTGEYVVEVFKISSNKVFRIDKFQNVWVYCSDKKGRTKIKKAKITAIDSHYFTCKPYDTNFNEVTFSDSDILYIGFTSTGRVLIATVSNLVIMGVAVIITLGVVILAVLSGSSPHISDPDFGWVPFVPFRKNINFYKSVRGERKWAIRILKVNKVLT